MKSKRIINIVSAIGAGVLLMFSVFVFPFILAASPENAEIETMEAGVSFPSEDAEQPDEGEQHDEACECDECDNDEQPEGAEESGTVIVIDINAISKEKAIEIAIGGIKQGTDISSVGELRTSESQVFGARYMASTDYIDVPVWRVLRYDHSRGNSFEYTPKASSVEEYFTIVYGNPDGPDNCCVEYSMGEDVNGVKVVVRNYNVESLNLIDINAFTGEVMCQWGFRVCHHTEPWRSFSGAANLDWDGATWDEALKLFGTDLSPEPGLIPEPAPIPIPEPTPEPSPQPRSQGALYTNGLVTVTSLEGEIVEIER